MQRIDDHLASHHGVISRAEAVELGATEGQIDGRLRSGRWVRLAPRVYRLNGAPRTWVQRARGLVLSTGGVVSHRGAARMLRIDGFGRARHEITVGPTVSRPRTSGVIWHRSTQMHLVESVEVRRVAVTPPARTMLDLAAVIPYERLGHAVDEVLRRKLTTWPELYGTLVTHSRQGRNGCGPMRALLDERYGQRVPDSTWNRLVGELLLAAGIDGFEYEYQVFDHTGLLLARVDLAWPRSRLAVELDSHSRHDNPVSFVSDRRRSNRLVDAGWRVLSFTWGDFIDDPVGLVQLVRAQLPTPKLDSVRDRPRRRG